MPTTATPAKTSKVTILRPTTAADTRKVHVLVVDDDTDLLTLLGMRLRSQGFDVSTAGSALAALAQIEARRPDVVVSDILMDGMDGKELFAEIERRYRGLPVILLTAHGNIPDAVTMTQRGAFGYLTKPYDSEHLMAEIRRAALANTSVIPVESMGWNQSIITRSPLMQDLLTRAQRIAGGDSSVLVSGESGTGKELLARAVHDASRRKDGPFIAINCAAMPEALLESELFGHRKGAFTGAVEDHRGLFEEASGGTLFLDEIGDMPLTLQAKLLRALESREVRPVGGTQVIPIDVRVISATHRDLPAAVAAGDFREDLYYRLNVLTLQLPALRERREDIAPLAAHFVSLIAPRYGRSVRGFMPEALAALTNAQWPGNIRQLQNVIEQSIALCQQEWIPVSAVEQALDVGEETARGFEEARRRFEFEYLTQLMRQTNGSAAQAAKIAKRNRTEFYKLLQRHSIEPSSFKGK